MEAVKKNMLNNIVVGVIAIVINETIRHYVHFFIFNILFCYY